MRAAAWERVIGHLSTALVVLDARFRVLALNPAAETLLGTSARRSVGMALSQVVRDTEYDTLARRAVATGGACVERNMPLGLHLVDCTATPLPATATGHEAPDNARPCVVLELADVEQHRRMVHEGRLLRQNRAVEAMVRGLAHEIRNPLGGLRGAAQLLERELESGSAPERADELTEYTGVIIAEADRLNALVERLLTPDSPAEFRPVNVHRVTEHVRMLIETEMEADARPAAIERDYDPSIPPLPGDFDQLVQVVLNVVRNAVQAGAVRIVLRTRIGHWAHIGPRQHPLVVRLEVIDDGPGVPPELADSIFLPMVSGRAEGSGFGLSIAQSLAGRHGGIIEYERGERGTTFSILLPLDLSPSSPPDGSGGRI